MTEIVKEAHDNYLIYVPDSTARLPRFAWRHDAVVRAMDELGNGARVLRITEGELCRDVTDQFLPPEPEDYRDEDVDRHRWNRERAAHYSFGKMVHR